LPTSAHPGRRLRLPWGLDASVVLVMLGIVLAMAVFVFWYSSRTGRPGPELRPTQLLATPTGKPALQATAVPQVVPVAAVALPEPAPQPVSALQAPQPALQGVAPAVAEPSSSLAPGESLVAEGGVHASQVRRPAAVAHHGTERSPARTQPAKVQAAGPPARCDPYNPYGEAMCVDGAGSRSTRR
jgi:hypothetical protein